MIYDNDSDDDCWMEIAPPVITSPLNNSVVPFALGITVQTNYTPNILGIALASTEYELRTGPKGTGILVSSGSSLLNTSVIIPGVSMSANTQYYVRVRHNTLLYSSMFSNDIVFTTGSI